jgi:glycosyltransferase involved in cell wall biosynthesis
MKAILLEPRLRSKGHHYFTYVMALNHALKRFFLDVVILIDHGASNDIVRELNVAGMEVSPLFRSQAISRLRIRALAWPLTSLEYGSRLYLSMRKRRFNSLWLTLSGNIEYVTGASLFALLAPKGRKVIIQMYQWDTREHSSRTPGLLRLYRYLTERLARVAIDKGRLVIAGQSGDISEHIATRIGRSIPKLPYLTQWDTFPPARDKHVSPTVGFLGVARAEKGFGQFARAVETLSHTAKIVVQVQIPEALGEPGIDGLVRGLERLHDCEIIYGELEMDAYTDVFSRLDILVLPYRPTDFQHKTSNIFSEAIGTGKVVVTPAETLMGQLCKRLGVGVTYSPYEAGPLAMAIDDAIRNFNTLAHDSRRVASDWQRTNTPEQFLSELLKIAGYCRDCR